MIALMAVAMVAAAGGLRAIRRIPMQSRVRQAWQALASSPELTYHKGLQGMDAEVTGTHRGHRVTARLLTRRNWAGPARRFDLHLQILLPQDLPNFRLKGSSRAAHLKDALPGHDPALTDLLSVENLSPSVARRLDADAELRTRFLELLGHGSLWAPVRIEIAMGLMSVRLSGAGYRAERPRRLLDRAIDCIEALDADLLEAKKAGALPDR